LPPAHPCSAACAASGKNIAAQITGVASRCSGFCYGFSTTHSESITHERAAVIPKSRGTTGHPTVLQMLPCTHAYQSTLTPHLACVQVYTCHAGECAVLPCYRTRRGKCCSPHRRCDGSTAASTSAGALPAEISGRCCCACAQKNTSTKIHRAATRALGR